MMVQHHIKYEEIHGVDEVIMMEQEEHVRLHQRLRREKKCLVPAAKLNAISQAAHTRTNKGIETHRLCCQRHNKQMNHKKNRIRFLKTVGKNVQFIETIAVNPNTGTLYCGCHFCGTNGMKLKIIDI